MHRRYFARSAISMEALAGGVGELLRRRGERADGVLQGNRTLTRSGRRRRRRICKRARLRSYAAISDVIKKLRWPKGGTERGREGGREGGKEEKLEINSLQVGHREQ